MRSDDDPEMSYLRAVEDTLAELRRVVHQLTQKEIHLARKWWKDDVPLEAVRSGILEIVAKRQAEGKDTAFGLSYCRHAVLRHAKLLAEMRSGKQENWAEEEEESAEHLEKLRAKLQARADALEDETPELAACIRESLRQLDIVRQVGEEGILFNLESNLLEACFEALPGEKQEEILRAAHSKAEASGAMGKALDRSRMVFRDKILRDMYELPSFE